jgi:DNA-binding phage protein
MNRQIRERRHAATFKRAIVRLIKRGMTRELVGRHELARRLRVSRAQLDRVLDPANPAVRLDAAMKAARAVNQKLRIVLTD